MKYIIKNQDRHIFQNRFYDFDTENLLSPIETQNYSIIQVAQSYYNHGFTLKDHHQVCDLELTFSHMNGLLCATNGVYERVDKHKLYLSFHADIHALQSRSSARFQTLAINVKEGPSRAMLSAIQEKAQQQRTFYVPDIFDCLSRILSEFKLSDAVFFENNLDCLITSVLVKLARYGAEETLAEIPSYDEKLSAMKDYIDARFLQLYALEELSSVFGYTYSHISKAFKKTHGITPSNYLLSKKMAYACTMLEDGAKLEEIAEILGYSTAFNFSRAFKTYTGVSPDAYKKQKAR